MLIELASRGELNTGDGLYGVINKWYWSGRTLRANAQYSIYPDGKALKIFIMQKGSDEKIETINLSPSLVHHFTWEIGYLWGYRYLPEKEAWAWMGVLNPYNNSDILRTDDDIVPIPPYPIGELTD